MRSSTPFFIAWRLLPVILAIAVPRFLSADEIPPGELEGASKSILEAAKSVTTSTEAEEVAAALSELRKGTAGNDPSAALALGYCEEHGMGTARSLEKAKAHYQRAADGGSTAGMRRLGRLLRLATETAPPDYSAARLWLGKAEAAGDADATLELARMDYAGEGILRPDPEKARVLLGVAAEAGSTGAMIDLGRACKQGVFSGEPDPEGARTWFEKADGRGDPVGALELGFLFEEGVGVGKDLDRALFYYRSAAERKLPEAMLHLGMCALNGIGGEKDERAALEWFRRGAAAHSPLAMFQIARYYDDGLPGVRRDPSTAIEWYRKAADLGEVYSQNQLGTRYRDGRDVTADAAEAYKWFSAAAARRFPAAMVNLGAMYEKGYGTAVPQDYTVASRLYTEAARQNDSMAQFLLARLFAQGNGVPKDPVAAYVLAVESARRGQEAAEELRNSLEQVLTPDQRKTADERLKQARSAEPEQ